MLGGKLLVDLNSERTDLKRRLSELEERYGEKHPRMIAARAELAQVERDFRAQIEKGVEAARQELGVIRAAESKVRALVEAQQQQIRARSGKAFQLSQLEREVESNRALVEVFLHARVKLTFKIATTFLTSASLTGLVCLAARQDPIVREL